jgi:hypothetical protein
VDIQGAECRARDSIAPVVLTNKLWEQHGDRFLLPLQYTLQNPVLPALTAATLASPSRLPTTCLAVLGLTGTLE